MIFRLSTVALALLFAASPLGAQAQSKKDSVVIGMTLEPPGLDATAGAAAAIGEITHLNIYEGLTKVNGDGTVTPLLASGWTVSGDVKTYTFKLLPGIKFQDGEPFSSADVKFSFERAVAADSTNKSKAFFQTIAKIDAPDPATVIVTFKDALPDAPYQLGLSPAVIVDPKSAPTNATKPIGTGPFKFDNWVKGSSVTLTKWDGFREAASVKLAKVTFRIINDEASQVASLLAGDVDAFPRFQGVHSVDQFKADPRFTVTGAGTEGKTIMSINNKRKPLDDVRVRRALSYAVDRKAIIDGAMNGYGVPIGSHYTPLDLGYVDLTSTYPYDPEKAKALLKEAGVENLKLTLTLPPPPYARSGGEIIAAELGKIGIEAKIVNVEWAQWLSGVFKEKNYDLTIISHVEPLDLTTVYGDPNYYIQYDSQEFRDIMHKANSTVDVAERKTYLAQAQKKLAEDAVNVFLFQNQQISVANAKLKGLWNQSPYSVNDMSAVYWQ